MAMMDKFYRHTEEISGLAKELSADMVGAHGHFDLAMRWG